MIAVQVGVHALNVMLCLTGTAQAVIRLEGRVWTTIEEPILRARGVPYILRK
ncbi:MAG: hypothetical protein RLZZ502_757 [Pseudomonadota bacterium]|jgi:hypothetical protein